ncbi:CHAT domain-containing protein [Streptomyces geranii]|uniref:CHAT domain-containing protein n=1 Tax=Streptomyces geranii TaxID=2058923 RepID=UPI000D034512|nr:CHAT domain-containing protein [Streptomyces geranii]
MTARPQDLPPPPPAGALELATLLSIATRIEPELIRAVRLRLLPHLDVGAEADLWFCDWVGARTPEAIALLPECLPYLRAGLVQRLETDPRLREIIDIVTEVHRGLSPALLLEEQVTWSTLTGDTEAAAQHLNRALHALVRENRSGLAGWFAEAWTRLPVETRATTTAWSLANAARPHVPSLDPGTAPELTLTTVSSIATAVGEARLGVQREGSALLLGDVRGTSAAEILVPDTHPRVVEVVTGSSTRTVRVDATAVVRVEVGLGRVDLRTGAGHVYELDRPAQPSQRTGSSDYQLLRNLLGPDPRPEVVVPLTWAMQDLVHRFRLEDDLAALREAFDLAERVVAVGYDLAVFPELGAEAAEAAYLQGFRHGTRKPLELAVRIGQDLLDTADPETVVRVRSVLGAAFRELFSHTGEPAQLDRSVDTLERPLDRLSASGVDTQQLVSELLRTYVVLHEVEQHEGIPRRAMALAAEASRTADSPEASALPLAQILVAHHRTTGSPEDLDRAEWLARRRSTAEEPRAVQSERAATVAAVNLARFWATGSQVALADALEDSLSAMTLSPPGDRLRLARLRIARADVLRVSFALSGDPAELAEAVTRTEQAVKSLPRMSPWRKAAYNSLTRCLLDRFRQGGDVSDLDRAIDASMEVVTDDLPDTGLPYRYTALVQEAECQFLQYRATMDIDFLHRAVTSFREARASGPRVTSAQHVAWVTGYASALLEVHTIDGSHAALASGLTELDSVLEEVSASEHVYAMLASALLARGEVISRMADSSDSWIRPAADDARLIAREPFAQPLQRLRAALLWGSLAMRMGLHDEVVQSYETVTKELPPVLLLPGGERGAIIRAWEERSREAAACAIEEGEPERALEFLEQRSVLLSAWTMDSHAEVDRLTRAAPSLATELRWLWTLLHLDNGPADKVAFRQRGPLQARMAHLVEAVRAVPGFESFLAPLTADRMITAAREGPVVVLSAVARRCDALLVTRKGVSALPLPNLSLAELTDQARRYHRAWARSPGLPDDGEAWGVLGWLWETTVWPVLSALGLADPTTFSPAMSDPDRSVSRAPDSRTHSLIPSDFLPRIWWCPTGPFTVLPLHVAGQPERTALDHAVHSYTPSLEALMTARNRERHQGKSQEQRMLLVLAEEGLRYGATEVDVIQGIVPDAHVLRGPEATVSNVAMRLADYSFFHFTGHAHLQHGVPQLQFAAGEGLDWRHLPQNLLADGALAYLAACETAGDDRGFESGGWTIAASFQAAGYRHVIGVLGMITDRESTRIAVQVYELLVDSVGRLRPENAARALHTATQQALATSHPRSLASANVVHLGP